jgi:oxygen-independent coproporphyrinogen-3 oxidase
MSGIYIHIPFCKQACHYCDFHFSTTRKHQSRMINAICQELKLRKNEINTSINTIYFGGGTPSLLSKTEIDLILQTIHANFQVNLDAEITLEANPDDLSQDYLKELASTEINRLSIGVQSFFEDDLKLMNRAHNAKEAITSVEVAKTYFENISIDLIYGIPEMSTQKWQANLAQVFKFDIPHVSCYALTVEPNTALERFIAKEVIAPVNDDLARKHYDVLQTQMREKGYENYEFSNFGKPDFFSQNNMAYWTGKPYLGIGPSAHSFNGYQRSWSVKHNIKYLKAIEAKQLPLEIEHLTTTDRFNEYIMTRLRTNFGVDLNEVEAKFGLTYRAYLTDQLQTLLKDQLVIVNSNEVIHVTENNKFLTDGISAELFKLNLG